MILAFPLRLIMYVPVALCARNSLILKPFAAAAL